MFSTTLVITFISVGTVLMESNLNELCSENYFNSFVASYLSGNITEIQITRKVDSNESAYHSWSLLIEEQFESFKTINISYKFEEGQIPSSSLSQPEFCGIEKNITYSSGETERRTFSGIELYNVDGVLKAGPISHNFPGSSEALQVSGMTSIRAIGLLCKVSNKILYVIGEDIKSKDSLNRKQFIAELRFEPKTTYPTIQVKESYIYLKFWLESTNKTVFEFFGIDCPIDDYSVSTHVLFVIFLCLFVSGITLAVIDFILIIRRRKPKMSSNTDMPSDVTLSPGENTSEASSKSSTEESTQVLYSDPSLE